MTGWCTVAEIVFIGMGVTRLLPSTAGAPRFALKYKREKLLVRSPRYLAM